MAICSGHINGIEVAIHTMQKVVDIPTTDIEAILVVDASNAFNCLNRAALLCNIQQFCPSVEPMVINTYWQPLKLFVDGAASTSYEGTTQEDRIVVNVHVCLGTV